MNIFGIHALSSLVSDCRVFYFYYFFYFSRLAGSAGPQASVSFLICIPIRENDRVRGPRYIRPLFWSALVKLTDMHPTIPDQRTREQQTSQENFSAGFFYFENCKCITLYAVN